MKHAHALALVAALAISPLAAAQQADADPKLLEAIGAAFDDLTSADARKLPSAYVSGTLMLRDATYRYGERITEDGSLVAFAGYDCDIMQVVLSVLEGGVTLAMTEANATTESALAAGTFIYPDKLTPQSGMFAYTLYTSNRYKMISLINGDFNGDTSSAKVTAFSYCFSTLPAAYDVFFDNAGYMY